MNIPTPYGAVKDLRRRQLARYIWEDAGVEDDDDCDSNDNRHLLDDDMSAVSELTECEMDE